MSLLPRLAAAVLALAAVIPACAAPAEVHNPAVANEGSKYYLFSTGPGISFYCPGAMRESGSVKS